MVRKTTVFMLPNPTSRYYLVNLNAFVMQKISFIGSALGYGAQNFFTSLGPKYMKEIYNIVGKLNELSIESDWYNTVEITDVSPGYIEGKGNNHNLVSAHNRELNCIVKNFLTNQSLEFPIIIGGDHSCAIGSWSGIIETLNANRQYGLIWVDAHMDAHTLNTSPSKAYHGMPISFLLGKNTETFGLPRVYIDPNNLVMIGLRSFEKEEKELLDSLQVKIFYINEVHERGLKKIFEEALLIVTNNTKSFGLSIDLDAIDPEDAPAVGSRVSNGILWRELKVNLPIIFSNQKFSALEIAEFNPKLDVSNKTAEIILQIATILGKFKCNTKKQGSNCYFNKLVL
jgi:arginase